MRCNFLMKLFMLRLVIFPAKHVLQAEKIVAYLVIVLNIYREILVWLLAILDFIVI